MRISELLEELNERKCYQKFKQDYPNSFFCAGFFVLDLIEKTEKIQLDFFLPTKNKIASFEHPFAEEKIHEDEILEMKEQVVNLKIDIDDLEPKVMKSIEEKEPKINPNKIIAIIKNNIWNLTIMDNTLNILRMKINALDGSEISFEKVNFFDIAKIKKS